MFIGRRDPEIRIVVEQDKCKNYTAKTGGSWVEVSIPPEDVADYSSKWETIMVDKKQVDNLSHIGALNCVRVNDGADIVCSLKDEHHQVVGGETLKPIQIIARFLKYYRWKEYERYVNLVEQLDLPSLCVYNDMVTTGQEMLSYMNRLPKVLPQTFVLEDFAPDDPLAGILGTTGIGGVGKDSAAIV